MILFAAARLPHEILFGAGQRHAIAAVAAKHGRRALICTDQRFSKSIAFAEIAHSLKASSIDFFIHDHVQPDVPLDTVSV